MHPAISNHTAEVAIPVINGLASSGAIPKHEARSLTAAIRDAVNAPKETDTARGAALVTRAEAAEFFRCSTKTVDRMLCDGALTRVYLRPGNAKSLRLRACELQTVASGSEATQ